MSTMRRLAFAGFLYATWGVPAGVSADELTPLQELGRRLFFDPGLSHPRGQSCASCHQPQTGFTSPDAGANRLGAVHHGAVPQRFGNRKPPSAAYAAFSPPLTYDSAKQTWVGGLFWDGRASTAAEQATKPLLNPLEHNLSSAAEVVAHIRKSPHAALYEEVFGPDAFANESTRADEILNHVGEALAAFERSSAVSPFSSKYDAYLGGRAKLNASERRGLALFEGQAKCASCHPHRPGEDGSPPLFTDFTYDNLGVPRNPENPFYRMPASVNPQGAQYVDLGLGPIVKDANQNGRFKVPTLRNVDLRPNRGFVKAYTHNGFFKSLKEVVHFYNVRDVVPSEFPPPEYAPTVNRQELGHLGLTPSEEDDVVAFLKTLSDGYGTQADHQPVGPAVADDDPRNFTGSRDVARVRRFLSRRQLQAQGPAAPPYR